MKRAHVAIVLAVGLTGCATPLATRVAPPLSAYGRSPDPALACRLLQASRCAYAISGTGRLDRSNSSYPACSDGSLDQTPIADKERQVNAVLVELTTDSVIIAYRGTLPPTGGGDTRKTLEDWIQDTEARPIREQGIAGQMHLGFHTAFVQTRDDLLAVLAKWNGNGALKGKNIYVTGHSKGGAMAIIAAIHLFNAGYKPKAVYTFALARAGDGEFRQGYEDKDMETWRYENRFDIVPHLPPNSADGELLQNLFDQTRPLRHDEYQSVGYLMFINWDGHLTASYDGLNEDRIVGFRERVRMAGTPEAIINAHSSSVGGQYGQAICGE